MRRSVQFVAAGALGALLLAGGIGSAAQPNVTAPAVGAVREAPVQPVVSGLTRGVGDVVHRGIQERPHFAEGEEVPVYKLKPVSGRQAQERAVALANRLLNRLGGSQAFTAAGLRQEGDYLSGRSGRVKLQVYANSGFISVMNQDRVYKGTCSVSDAQAAEIARKFVTESKIVDLLPGEEITLASVKHVRSQAILAATGQASEPVLNNVVVVLGRKLGGQPVIGPGGQLVVFLAGAGEVVGLQRNWREVEPVAVGRVRTKGPSSVSSVVTEKLTRALGGKTPPGQALRVKRVDYGYFADGKHRVQGFLQPAYAVHVEVQNPRGPNIAKVVLAPAGEKEFEPLTRVPPGRAGAPRPATPPPAEGADEPSR